MHKKRSSSPKISLWTASQMSKLALAKSPSDSSRSLSSPLSRYLSPYFPHSSTTQSLLRAHLHLYSPTQIFHPTSEMISSLLARAETKEREVKVALSTTAAGDAEMSSREREGMRRMRSLLEVQ
jgi:hypothetical protein